MALQLFYISFSSNGELKTSICQQNESFARLEFTKWRSIFIAPSSFALFLPAGGLSIEYTMFMIYFHDIKTLLCLIIVAMFLRLRETHNTLQCGDSFSSSCSSCFSASVIKNIGEFVEKNYFTDNQTANTIHCFRDSVPVLKTYNCY